MTTFSIQHQLTLKEYRKIYFILLYSKIWVILISIFSVMLIVLTVILWITKHNEILDNDYYQYSMIIVYLALWTPLLSFYSVWRNYKSVYGLDEPTTYNFSDEGYTTARDSCNSKYAWNKIYKVKITKGWLILYLNRRAASIIKIEDADRGNIEELKQFLKAGNFKAKLKW